jgi:Na+-translocating ferredoxin:NAD+ oxidoreductase RnfE subunit
LSHPWHTENLIYLLLILLVLNVEIVVPTADQYAKRLGASESFWVGRSLKGLGLDVSMVGIGSPRLFI